MFRLIAGSNHPYFFLKKRRTSNLRQPRDLQPPKQKRQLQQARVFPEKQSRKEYEIHEPVTDLEEFVCGHVLAFQQAADQNQREHRKQVIQDHV